MPTKIARHATEHAPFGENRWCSLHALDLAIMFLHACCDCAPFATQFNFTPRGATLICFRLPLPRPAWSMHDATRPGQATTMQAEGLCRQSHSGHVCSEEVEKSGVFSLGESGNHWILFVSIVGKIQVESLHSRVGEGRDL